MRIHQGYYLSKYQQQLLNETHQLGMTADMLRKWERHPEEERRLERRHTYLSMSIDVPANFSSYHKDAALILLRQHHDAAAAIADLNQIRKHEAKAFTLYHQFGLTLNFIRENRHKFIFNETSIKMLNLLIEKEHKTFQQALDEIEGMEPWLYEVVIDLYASGLRCEHIRELLSSKETENFVRNACMEYYMHAKGFSGFALLSNVQFKHFVKNVFHGTMKRGATAQDAWLITSGQLLQIMHLYNVFSNYDEPFWNAPRSVQADYLMAGFREGINPRDIPLFTREYWKTYLALRVVHHLSGQEAIAEIRAVCTDLSKESLTWWANHDSDTVFQSRNHAKMQFLRKHYGEGVRGKDLAGCPFAKNALKQCMDVDQIGAKRTIALLNEMEPVNKEYLLLYSRRGVSLQMINSTDFLHVPSIDEMETFIALVEIMGMKPDDAFKLVANKDDNVLRKLLEGSRAVKVLTGEDQAVESGQRLRM